MTGRSGVRTSIQSMRCRPERCPGVYTPVLSTGWPTAEAGVYVAKARVVMQVPTSLRWLLPDVLRLGGRPRPLLALAGSLVDPLVLEGSWSVLPGWALWGSAVPRRLDPLVEGDLSGLGLGTEALT